MVLFSLISLHRNFAGCNILPLYSHSQSGLMDKAELGIHSYLAFVDGKNVCTNWIILGKSISKADIYHTRKKSDSSGVKACYNCQWIEKCSCWQS